MVVSGRPRGVDVASYQSNPNWDAVAASGIAFAFTKVTEDDGYINPYFARNWREIKRVGLYRGAYHFARPEVSDATIEADYMLAAIEGQGGLAGGDIVALDLEAGSGDLGPWVLTFCRRVEQQAGVRPLIYTGAWFSGPHNLVAYPEIGTYGLWLAAYAAVQPDPPPPWQFTAFWQYTDQGSVPGISGPVDMSLFNGPADRIPLYGKPASSPSPPPTDPSAAIREQLAAIRAAADRIEAALT